MGYIHFVPFVSELVSTHNYKNTKPAFGGAQILTFQPVSDKQVGVSATFTITADSGLTTFTFDSNDSTVASFGGNATDGYTVTGLKEGKVTITATQPGQTPSNSATASQPFIVTQYPVRIRLSLSRIFLIRMYSRLLLIWMLMQLPDHRKFRKSPSTNRHG